VTTQPVSPRELPPSIPDETDEAGRFPAIVVAILALVAVGGVVDLVLDRPQRLLSAHVLFELVLVSLSLATIAALTVRWRRTSSALAGVRHALDATRRSLADRQAERDRWRASAQSALAGLAIAIDRQFAAWELTPAEREVALLLLQGVGHKQVAARTGRSERTVRQHAVSVYQKAGLGGRAELAAFFLQDLMLPNQAEAPTPRREP
jgi:DNA-binding CsgD family transcriptional regulator